MQLTCYMHMQWTKLLKSMHPKSAYESITHPNTQTKLQNCAQKDAISYTEWNRSKVAGIEGRREDKREAWAARESRGGSKNHHVVRFKVKHNHGNLRKPFKPRCSCQWKIHFFTVFHPPCAESGQLMTCWFLFFMNRTKVRTQVGWNNFPLTITVDALSTDTFAIIMICFTHLKYLPVSTSAIITSTSTRTSTRNRDTCTTVPIFIHHCT